jgi:hypothetical protein
MMPPTTDVVVLLVVVVLSEWPQSSAGYGWGVIIAVTGVPVVPPIIFVIPPYVSIPPLLVQVYDPYTTTVEV